LASAGQANIAILSDGHCITITEDVIGDDDAPAGIYQPHYQSYSGITFDLVSTPGEVTAWIYSNIIECLGGTPAIGILVQTDNVIIGKDNQGGASEAK
jgi:hypothetical protein